MFMKAFRMTIANSKNKKKKERSTLSFRSAPPVFRSGSDEFKEAEDPSYFFCLLLSALWSQYKL